MRLGLDIRLTGTPDLTWRRLASVTGQLRMDQASALYRDLWPDHSVWDIHAQLLAAAVSALRVANWQRTTDATKRSPRQYPDAVRPPWVSNDNGAVTKFGTAHMSVAEANEWLGW